MNTRGSEPAAAAATVPLQRIEGAVVVVRGQNVILDRDLAVLYGIETRVLNQAVKRNAERFPPDFMFALTREEIMRISQVVTSPGLKFSKSALAFTEQGVAMLSSVLRSPQAVQVNIAIMRAFVRLRELLASDRNLSRRLDALEAKYDGQFRTVFEAIRRLMAPPVAPLKKRMGFQVEEERGRYTTRKASVTKQSRAS